MNWVNYILKNHFVIYLLSLTLCVAGLFCLFIIPVAPFPLPKFNYFDVGISYSGANAVTVEKQITSKAVSALQALPHIENIESQSRQGYSDINFQVNSKDHDVVLETQMRALQALSSAGLPEYASAPSINQSSGYAEMQDFVVTSDHLSLFNMSNYLNANLYPSLKSIPGVSLFHYDQDPVIHIQWIPAKLAQYHLQPMQISSLVDQAFQSSPLGSLYISNQPYTLLLKNPLQNLNDFANLIVGYNASTTSSSGSPIYLRDIANINFAPRQPIINSSSSFNGHPSLYFSLSTSGVANPFLVSKKSSQLLKQITPTLPADMHITVTYNSVKDMRDSFNEVLLTIAVSSLLVLLITWMFLGRLRLTFIPIITIPICLLGAGVFITALGLSLNIITLLAMVIAVGLVVDDSIVVVENIIHYMERGFNKAEAIVQGTSSIALTIVGITATLLAVYLPISFVKGQMFMFFLGAFAIPLAAAVFISGLVALTLTPVMCVAFIADSKPNRYQQIFNNCLASVIKSYHFLLRGLFKKPLLSLLGVIVLIIIGVYMIVDMPREFFASDPSSTVSINVDAATTDTMQSVQAKLQRFAPFFHDNKVESYWDHITTDSQTGALHASLSIKYKAKYLHKIKLFSDNINSFIKKNNIEDSSARMNNVMNSGGGSYDMSATLYGSAGIKQINQQVARLTAALNKSSVFSEADNYIAPTQKQLQFIIDDVTAARFGVYHSDISSLLASYYGGYSLRNDFSIAGLSVPVVLGLDNASLRDPNSMQQLQIRSSSGIYYPLTKFVSLKMVAQPTQINTFSGKPSVVMDMRLAKGHSLGEGISYFNSTVASLTPDLSIHYDGSTADYIEGSNQGVMVMILGIGCVYLLLSLLFRSLLDPFIILLTVPFSVVGGALSLHLFGGSINLFSTLSLITLVGLITKHGVLIVRFANAQLQKGARVKEAVLQATCDRFRPIIMTTLAMTLGVLPLALSSKTMYVSRQDLAIVLMGGLLIGTLFSLYVVPLVYVLLKKNPKTI